MRIIIASSFVPFVPCGARFLADWLHTKLVEAGHRVETILLPFEEKKSAMFEQMISYRMLDLTESCDRLITTRSPAHLLRHPNKVAWFIHHFRAFHDLWGKTDCNSRPDAATTAFCQRLIEADTVALSEARSLYTSSGLASARLRRRNGLDSEVLYPPLLDASLFSCRDFLPTIVSAGRLEPRNRPHLLIEAMRFTRSNARLVLAGKVSCTSYAAQLRAAIATHDLAHKVELRDAWISEQEKADLLNECTAVAYVPCDEDFDGYACLEAMHAGKPVLSTTDSGGVRELVVDHHNGLLVSPLPTHLAAVIDELIDDRMLAERLGGHGIERLEALDITWDRVLHAVTR
jgi:glycosyltransferase involved in cell wall biosynthesis